MCWCTDNKIGDVGAQSIGDGLKSLKALTTLNLNGEWYMVWLSDLWCAAHCWEWMYREHHWGHWSTIHWWWSQVINITYNTEFESWVMCDVWRIVVLCADGMLVIQGTTLEILEHNPLVIVSSHSHHLQNWICLVSDVWCVMWCRLMECVCLSRQQDWTNWSTIHRWWSQIIHITEFEWWVMCTIVEC